MTIYGPIIEDFANLITYSNSSWNVVSWLIQSDFRYLHSFTPKNGVKFGNISKIAIFVVMERAIPEGDQATGEALVLIYE